ncbi:TetR/AcrR family transcriptional regulator [Siphonobacter aquaeclarae]|jgi:TetR/AcrR family transcriptional regulator|uniref:Transcriptional regulator, TetR family n=1 Tax=Siphonobacter aquaeclarae TaxID=563176 RepID=A0A1G9SIP8_9BACT|nr:TetR family transcriptional regulator [Siphonobacter aquaeclarae]MBO9638610.1 TetR/AcrR family transcriptional regulator [Siphonobacter aquaeclarae]SDM35299.1 transcriptional regulator, TetR family [Siphonobacter aquaeclarae]
MTTNQPDTEEKIKEAARKIFLEKGYDGTTIRDIAETAQINTALTNYYFRSKEKLFWLVFESMLRESIEKMQAILDKPIDLKIKLSELIDHMFRLQAENPNISLFFMNEIRRDPAHFVERTGVSCRIVETFLNQQLEEEYRAGRIREISALHLLPLVFGTIQQVFASRTLHMFLFQVGEEEFMAFAQEQKRLVMEMVLNWLYREN